MYFFRQNVSTAALFLAAKIEEQPRKLEHMAKMFHSLHNREGSDLDISSPVSSVVQDGPISTCTSMVNP